jgi:tetratricopeptide (TPR) repeat protein
LLRELACDPRATVYIRLYAARILLNQQFPAEAYAGFWAMAQDTNITDPRTRVSIAQGLSELGPAARVQAFIILTAVVSDNSVPQDIRFDAAKATVPLCDNLADAGTFDGILRRWVRSLSPAVWLQGARILHELAQYHRDNVNNLVVVFGWEARCTRLLRAVILSPTAITNPLYSVQALRLMGKTGDSLSLVSLGMNPRLSYANRNEAAAVLESLGEVDEAARIWLDLAQVTNRLVVTPAERVKAAYAAGQRGYLQQTKEILQSVAQDTCVSEPRTCFEAATALRQLGYYEEAIAFIMVLDKNQRDNPDLKTEIAEAMRWRELP